MAQAVRDLHPDVRFAIGPPIDDGFYYDFDLGMGPDGRPTTFSPEDLAAIEKRMRQIIAGKHPFQYREVSADEARALFAGQPVSYTHLRAHETVLDLVCRLLLEKKKTTIK